VAVSLDTDRAYTLALAPSGFVGSLHTIIHTPVCLQRLVIQYFEST
jgi:hypothetical protein